MCEQYGADEGDAALQPGGNEHLRPAHHVSAVIGVGTPWDGSPGRRPVERHGPTCAAARPRAAVR